MDNPRKGRRHNLTCPVCKKDFSTDDKKVRYCSRQCTREAQKAYFKTPKGRESARKYQESMKEKRLASKINVYSESMYTDKKGTAKTAPRIRKRGLRR
jgi:hypothetical protein